MRAAIEQCLWSPAELGPALAWLVSPHSAAQRASAIPPIEADTDLPDALAASASHLNLVVTGITCAVGDIAACLSAAAPLAVPVPGSQHALFVVHAGARHAYLASPTGQRTKVTLDELIDALLASERARMEGGLSALQLELGRDAQYIGQRLLLQAGADEPLFLGWALEPARRTQGMARLLMRAAIGLVATHLLQYSLWIASWVALVMVLVSPGNPASLLTTWIATLASALLLLPVESALEQRLAARVGIAVKRRLLVDALNADKRYVGTLGLGQMIAQALESHHVDEVASRGAIRFTLALIDAMLITLAYALAVSADGLLLLFLVVVSWGMYRGVSYYRHAVVHLRANLAVTGVHTEQLVGHRTRKALLEIDEWNADEDRSIASYHESGKRLDDAFLRIALLPRAWVVLAMLVVLMTLFRAGGDSAGVTSITMVGFVIATFAALQSITLGASEAIRAWVSFKQVDTLAGQRPPGSTDTSLRLPDDAGEVICRGLNYNYPRSLTPVLNNVSLTIAAGERVLLSGRSGSGKSTLAAIVAGRIQQDSGVVLSAGVDRHIAGMARWRSLVCHVPQQGANHVLTETFAFNLLLGRPWPPTRQDMAEAAAVVAALGLDGLLERMPAGMMQMLGEGGWNLSQGEKARLFIARGILQRAQLLIADEVLSPLDAHTALQTLTALEQHCDRLLLIAHA
ncbi:MAG: ATP-binding cassette domain-containing protein [Gammaproteobacteria bacterium]|nr:ATP-binding cassette domain-containing protein [Gammaproteobacteria bacterium]